jgi:hypothetical protein
MFVGTPPANTTAFTSQTSTVCDIMFFGSTWTMDEAVGNRLIHLLLTM